MGFFLSDHAADVPMSQVEPSLTSDLHEVADGAKGSKVYADLNDFERRLTELE